MVCSWKRSFLNEHSSPIVVRPDPPRTSGGPCSLHPIPSPPSPATVDIRPRPRHICAFVHTVSWAWSSSDHRLMWLSSVLCLRWSPPLPGASGLGSILLTHHTTAAVQSPPLRPAGYRDSTHPIYQDGSQLSAQQDSQR